ncbi:MAG TPA: aldolase/citrate lyase family protein [Chloroflexota bacterium]|jgi:4-hydroxy-2-oxoheptanedioate aldolase|nr:aldolase/citrate lyase family protein [Chloroflexota bacterium]
MPRLNSLIGLLESDQRAFGLTVPNGALDDAMAIAESDNDFVIFDMEHLDFDFPNLRSTLQHLLNRSRIAKSGSIAADVVPLVRVPPNAAEMNQWVIKQALDCGVYGIVQPHLSTVEEARALIAAVRYPRPGEADHGRRGWYPRHASRYWGLSIQEYYQAAELWPYGPQGELFCMAIVEDREGVKNLPRILKEAPGLSAIWAGSGDLSVDMGHAGQGKHPEVESAIQTILHACLEANVPCCTIADSNDVEQRLEQGFRMIVAATPRSYATLEQGRQLAGRGA